MTGRDPEKIRRIPDTTGMKNEGLLQKPQQYGYDRSFTLPGAKLVRIGNDDGCTLDEPDAPIGDNAAESRSSPTQPPGYTRWATSVAGNEARLPSGEPVSPFVCTSFSSRPTEHMQLWSPWTRAS